MGADTIIWSQREDVSGEWRTSNNGKIYDLCSSNISVERSTKIYDEQFEERFM